MSKAPYLPSFILTSPSGWPAVRRTREYSVVSPHHQAWQSQYQGHRQMFCLRHPSLHATSLFLPGCEHRRILALPESTLNVSFAYPLDRLSSFRVTFPICRVVPLNQIKICASPPSRRLCAIFATPLNPYAPLLPRHHPRPGPNHRRRRPGPDHCPSPHARAMDRPCA